MLSNPCYHTLNLNDSVQGLEEKEMKTLDIENVEQAEAAMNDIIMETIGFPLNATIHDYKAVCKQLVEVAWDESESNLKLSRHSITAAVQFIKWDWDIDCGLRCGICLDVDADIPEIPRLLFYNTDMDCWEWSNSLLDTGKWRLATIKLVY